MSSLANYKTTINGTTIAFEYLFSRGGNSSTDNSGFKVNGADVKSKITLMNNTIDRDSDGANGGAYGSNDRKWGKNDGLTINIDTVKQTDIPGYSKNTTAIDWRADAWYKDYSLTQHSIIISQWVDHFIVIAVGRGGGVGRSRNTNDQHWKSPSGSSGGFMIWKSPTLHDKTESDPYIRYSIIHETDKSRIELIKASGNTGANAGVYTGIRGGFVNGDDDDDTHENTRYAAGWDRTNSTMHYYHGGEKLQDTFVVGRPSASNLNSHAPSHNAIADKVVGWNDYGRGQYYTGGDNERNILDLTNRGIACLRVYLIAKSQ